MFNNPFFDENIDLGVSDQGLEEGMRCVDTDKLNRLDIPIVLKPNDATFDDVAIHAYFRQNLGESTIEKHLRYARFMQNHLVPVDFFKPDLENFIRHLDYRRHIEDASPYALEHEWQTMKMFLRSYGLSIWDIRLPTKPKSHKRILPFPEIVREFWHYRYSKSRYERKLYQYMFFLCFLVGMRTPSELAIIKTGDFVFNRNGTAIMTIRETKKHNSERTIILPVEIASDPRRKSIRNWLDSWRPRVANGYSDDYLFLQPNGKPFTVRHLGHRLSSEGKKVWSYFQPYDTRHWCAVARLIQQKCDTGFYDVFPVRNWLGHEKIETTMGYVQYAEQYFQQASYDWVKRVLKYHGLVGVSALDPINDEKTLVSGGTPPVDEYGLGETCIGLQEDGCSINSGFGMFSVVPVYLFLFSFDSGSGVAG